ncbi:helix-turn-helix domain-containing protein [Flavobacterium sp. HNIBRBA15423]|uniref:helix-turn-helix domain-containing protein n=1 Tax=Flavobacterium sp. HNIBRBA15423 TaxID=3458683 RepID=UPI00404517B0
MKHYSLFKSVLFLCIPVFIIAQNKQNDLENLSYKELRVCFFKGYDENNNQIEYAKQYYKKAEKEKNELEKGRGYYLLAYSVYNDDENLSLSYFKKALVYSKKNNDTNVIPMIHYYIGGILQNQLKFKEAVNNYILADKTNKNEDFSYELKLNIGVIKSEYLGEIDEALQLYKECYNFYKTKGSRNPKYHNFYKEILFDIADAFKAKRIIDSATYYNKLGIIESQFSTDEEMRYLFILNEGANQVLNQNYKVALDSIEKALPIMIKHKNKGNTLAAYYYLGKIYADLNNKELAVKNFLLVDSMYLADKELTPEFSSGYNYLISFYKAEKDKENQLKYITRFMSIDSVFQKNYKEVYKTIQNEYTVPNLINDKESLIYSLKKEKKYFYWSLVIVSTIALSLSVFAIFQYKQKRRYRLRFEKIISESKITKTNESNKNKILTEQNIDIGIAQEVVDKILEKLNNFESQKHYLQNNITIQSLSEGFETNNKYLSKVIKKYREKTFIQYINDLRIEYAINQLQLDKKLRNYTIIALTKEFGFNSSESFSTAFIKKTGIKPLYFIKELEKLNN